MNLKKKRTYLLGRVVELGAELKNIRNEMHYLHNVINSNTFDAFTINTDVIRSMCSRYDDSREKKVELEAKLAKVRNKMLGEDMEVLDVRI